jgi:hypothetical protein
MISLSLDPILLIIFNLTNIHDVINLSNINKPMLQLFDNNLYAEWGRNLYTQGFWDKAEERSPSTYHPYISMKIELMRIDKFQNNLLKAGYEIWNNDDFYRYWKGLEQIKGQAPLKPPKGASEATASEATASSFKTPINNNDTNEEIYAALCVL